MKKKLLLLLLAFTTLTVSAKHVNEINAKKAGETFLASKSNTTISKDSQLELVYKEKSTSNLISTAEEIVFYYVFNLNNTGFIIVSGDDNVTPILGYSTEGIFNPNNIPPNAKKWFEEYKSQIRYVIENQINATLEIQEEWQNLLFENNTGFIAKASVPPLLTTKWDQDQSALCPSGTVTGCVATAMAQIMKYWNYPATGSGFHSYNHQNYGTLSANFGSTTYQWSSMPNVVNSSNIAVATLMYHCGVSVDMNYGPASTGGSGAQTLDVADALKTYFAYSNTVEGKHRSNYTQTQWINLLKNELNSSRPIQYAGTGSGGGHSFVCDGYDNNDLFHFNWGWGGSSDGYFQINALNPGSLGTGGGAGGFNSNQRAIIGIQPPSGTQTQTPELALYDDLNPSASTIYYGQAFNINTNVANYGTGAYSGDYAMAIFDDAYTFVELVDSLIGYTLQPSSAYTNNLTFSTTGSLSMLPGSYYAALFYRPTGENWMQVSDGNYTNLVQIDVINPNDIELNSDLVVSGGNTLTQGQSASVNFNIINDGNPTFIGQYSVNLYYLDGTFAQAIGTLNETNGLPSGYTYQSPYITVTSQSITVTPGTYLLAAQHNPNNTGWQLTGSSYFQNPIKVTVVAPAIQPDMYEVNNTIGQSYNLPISFSGNSTTKNTVGSNVHIGTDNDYFKVNLPSGYNYTINARLHDSYSSGNGNTYSVDALFSYSTDGSTWSDVYDDVLASSITIQNGGTVYFKVAPYFSGETGTYLLDMSLSRTQISTADISELDFSDLIRVYPNPANEYVTIDFKDFNGIIKQIEVVNVQGQFVQKMSLNGKEEGFIDLPLNKYANGIYLIRLYSEDGILTKKLTVNK